MTKQLKSIAIIQAEIESLKKYLTDLTTQSDVKRLEFDDIRARHRDCREQIIELENDVAYIQRLHEIAEKSEGVSDDNKGKSN